jgi:hypothetical protein
MNDSHRTPNKEDTQPAAQPENEDSSPSPEPDRRRLNKQEHKADHIKKLFATLAENTQANRQHFDRYLTRTLTHLLVLKMR